MTKNEGAQNLISVAISHASFFSLNFLFSLSGMYMCIPTLRMPLNIINMNNREGKEWRYNVKLWHLNLTVISGAKREKFMEDFPTFKIFPLLKYFPHSSSALDSTSKVFTV